MLPINISNISSPAYLQVMGTSSVVETSDNAKRLEDLLTKNRDEMYSKEQTKKTTEEASKVRVRVRVRWGAGARD